MSNPSEKPLAKQENFLDSLAKAYRLQEAILSSTELAIASTDNTGIVTSFNKAAEILLGISGDDVIHKLTITDFLDSNQIIERAQTLSKKLKINVDPGFEALVANTRQQGKPTRTEWTLIHRNGVKISAWLFVSDLRNNFNDITGFAIIALDIAEQKNIQSKISESESHLRALIRSMDDTLYEVDLNGRYLSAWAKNEDQLFLPRNEIIGRTLEEIYGKKYAQPFDEMLEKVLKTGHSQSYVYKALHEKEERFYNAKYSLIFHENKRTDRILISIRDVTTQKRIEQQVVESEQRFRLLAENVPGVIYLCNNDENYSMIYLNDLVEEITGYTKEEFLNGEINFPELYHPDDKENIITTVNTSLNNKKSFHLVYRLKTKNGRIRWIEEYGVGVYEENQLLWLEGFLSDITQRKRSEQEIIKISIENERVFNTPITLNAISNFEGYFLRLSPAWENTLGWSNKELVRRPYLSLVHPEDKEKTLETLEQLKSGNPVVSFENRYKSRNGSYRWLIWSSSADQKRKVVYSTAFDITSRKTMEEELLHAKHNAESIMEKLREQNKQLDEFAHIISHNLRSPVENIKTLLSFLNEKSSPKDYQIIHEKLYNVANSIGETMNELLDTLRIKKTTEIVRTEIRFSDVLEKVVQLLEGNLMKCGASVTFDFNQAPSINYHKPYLESIFQNLLSNAIKYRAEERIPEIHFETILKDQTIILMASDNGLGIDMEKFGDKLFGMHKTFHEHKEARGVGLFLTKTQIETMGGRISAHSEVNKGTTFIIEFVQN